MARSRDASVACGYLHRQVVLEYNVLILHRLTTRVRAGERKWPLMAWQERITRS